MKSLKQFQKRQSCGEGKFILTHHNSLVILWSELVKGFGKGDFKWNYGLPIGTSNG